MAALNRCLSTGNPPNQPLLDCLQGLLLPASGGQRHGVSDVNAMRRAAQYEAAHPSASLAVIAGAAGVSKSTLAGWHALENGDYAKTLRDARFLNRIKKAQVEAAQP
jgi:hypothetical protein